MKNLVKLTTLFALLLVSTFSYGQKFGHINSQELLAIFPESEDAQAQLQKYQKELEGQLEKMQVEYNNKLNNYVQQKDTISSFLRENKEKELQEMQQRMQSYQQNAQQELKKKESTLIQPLLLKANNAIKAIGERDKYVYIFDKGAGAIIYEGAGSTDITEAVIAEIYKADTDKKAKAMANFAKMRAQMKEAGQ